MVAGWLFWQFGPYGEQWITNEAFGVRNEKRRESYQVNRKATLERVKKYYRENKESIKEYIKAWKTANRHKVQASNSKRKAKLNTELTKAEKLELDGIYCQCNRLNEIFGSKVFTVDHTVPLSKGGKHHPSNLQVVSSHWNLKKGNSHSERWEAPYFGQRDLNKRLFSE
jgi:5-methylcytosine-specific restriction endonuclease McrA